MWHSYSRTAVPIRVLYPAAAITNPEERQHRLAMLDPFARTCPEIGANSRRRPTHHEATDRHVRYGDDSLIRVSGKRRHPVTLIRGHHDDRSTLRRAAPDRDCFLPVRGFDLHERDPGPRTRSWLLNLTAEPHFIFHLKSGVVADLPATATVITDPAEPGRIFIDSVDDFNQRHGPDSPWPKSCP